MDFHEKKQALESALSEFGDATVEVGKNLLDELDECIANVFDGRFEVS